MRTLLCSISSVIILTRQLSLRINIPEHQQIIYIMILQIIPFVRLVMMQQRDLNYHVPADGVGWNDVVLLVNGIIVADGKRPIVSFV